MSLRNQLKGTGVALITPFTAKGDVDYTSLEKVINFVIHGGVEYIVVLGTTGETPTLNSQERISVIKYSYLKINKRVPVVVGIGGNNTKELLHDIESFPLDKAAAVLSTSPYYTRPSQEGLFVHYKTLAEASPKPIILYNVPGRTGRNIDAATTLRLAREVKNIAGIKEASGDMAQCMQILRERPKDFLVVSGDDALALPQIACGMDGIISVAANSFPKQFSELIRLCMHEEFAKAKKINDKLIPAYEIMFGENNPAGVKAFMTEMGLLKNNLRLPLVPLSDEWHKKVKAYLTKPQPQPPKK